MIAIKSWFSAIYFISPAFVFFYSLQLSMLADSPVGPGLCWLWAGCDRAGIMSVASGLYSWDSVLLIAKLWCIRNKFWDCVSNLLMTALGEQGAFGKIIPSSLYQFQFPLLYASMSHFPDLTSSIDSLQAIFCCFPLSHPATCSVPELLELAATWSSPILNLYISVLPSSSQTFHEVRSRSDDFLLF